MFHANKNLKNYSKINIHIIIIINVFRNLYYLWSLSLVFITILLGVNLTLTVSPFHQSKIEVNLNNILVLTPSHNDLICLNCQIAIWTNQNS